MRNWVRNGFWHNPGTTVGQPAFTATNNNVNFGGGSAWWLCGPGIGGSVIGTFLEATQGQWEGNPDNFLSITWTVAPTQGQAERLPDFQFTFLEHFGIHTARICVGKQITVSWQLRSPGGCLVSPVIYRGGLDIPIQYRTPWPNISMQLWTGPQWNVGPTVKRFDFSMVLPPIPPQTSVVRSSFLGIGLDLVGKSGPTIDIGPVQLTEGPPADFDELPYWDEINAAAVP